LFVVQQPNGELVAFRARKTQAERRSESEQALLKAAIDVIASAGVGAVTFEALGRSGGFSRGLASVRFGSKARLIEAVLRHLRDQQDALVREHRFDELPGLDAVLGYADLCLRDMARRNEARAYFMLLSSSVADASETQAGFAATHAEAEERLHRWIACGQAEGTIRPELDPGAAALMIGCLMFGLSMQLLVDPSVDFAPLREASLAMLRTSLVVPNAA
jgi:AcrR family transcriptional regulator